MLTSVEFVTRYQRDNPDPWRPPLEPLVPHQLAQVRQRAGWSPWAFARTIGISPAHLWRIEHHERALTLPVLVRCCQVLGVAADVIVPALTVAARYANEYEGGPPDVSA